MNRLAAILILFGILTGCTAEPPPDSLTGLMILSQQVAGAGVVITPVSGHTSDYTLLPGRAGVYVSLRTQPTADVTIGPIGVSVANTVVGCTYCAGATSNYITIAPANWGTPVLIGYWGLANAAVSGDVTYTMDFGTVVSQDQLYNGIVLPSQTNVHEDRDRHVWLTAVPNGNLGGIGTVSTGADGICNGAGKPALPATATYKAMLVDVAGTRQASPVQRDWVFHTGYIYRNQVPALLFWVDGTGIISFGSNTAPLCTNNNGPLSLVGSTIGLIGAPVYTGMRCDWTTGLAPASTTCADWTSNNAVDNGNTGDPTMNNRGAIFNGLAPCNLPGRLVCVQQ